MPLRTIPGVAKTGVNANPREVASRVKSKPEGLYKGSADVSMPSEYKYHRGQGYGKLDLRTKPQSGEVSLNGRSSKGREPRCGNPCVEAHGGLECWKP
jgi:hypothetical protein